MAKREDLEREARSMSVDELYRSLSWHRTLSDHYAEIGEDHGNDTKQEVIRMELARRNR
jgi:hypothetical protein